MVAASFPADGSLNENVGPSTVLAPALVAPSMTGPTSLMFVTWIESDSFPVHRRTRCLAAPTRTLCDETLTSSVWMPFAGTPAARIAPETASAARLAADSACRELAAERDTVTETSATSGATNTEPEPSTPSVPGVASALAAEAEHTTTSDVTAATAHIYLRMRLPSSGLPVSDLYVPGRGQITV